MKLTSSQIKNTSVVSGTTVADSLNTLHTLVGGGVGDMFKNIYDTNNNGKVDISEAAEAVPWSGVTDKPTEFNPSSHNHSISEVANLQTALNDKADSIHSHTVGDITGLQTALDDKQDTLVSSVNIKTINGESLLGGGNLVISGGGGGGVTDHGSLTGLSDDDHPQYLTNSRGDARYSLLNHLHSAVTTSVNGFMSSADKTKLDGIAAGAQVNTVTSVAGKTGVVTLAKADVGLGNVDNTSDVNKPISTATQTALSNKLDKSGGTMTGVLTLFSENIPVTTNNLPALRPSLLLDFANSQQVDPRITFTRASTATYYDAQGVLRTAASGVPRIDHDPVTGECKGLLIEEARTNLLTYSEQFDNAAWSKNNVTVTANSVNAPDGSITADTLIEDTAETNHYLTNNCSVTAGQDYTASCYAKLGAGNRFFGLILPSSGFGVNVAAAFTLTGNGSYSIGTAGTGTSATITNVGGGWYRCTLTSQASVTNPVVNIQVRLSDSPATSNRTYLGDGTSGIYIWGAQLEAGAAPTSYIPTSTVATTRAADAASMTGTNFSEWYRQDEGTLVIDVEASDNPLANYGGVFAGSTVTEGSIYFDNNGGNFRNVVFSGGSAVAVLNLSAVGTAGVLNRLAAAYKTNAFVATRNGASVAFDNSGGVPSGVSRLVMGSSPSMPATSYSNSHIRRIAYYPRRLANAELQAITA